MIFFCAEATSYSARHRVYHTRGGIIDRIAGAAIAIARLSHRTGIDEIVHIVFQRDFFFTGRRILAEQSLYSVSMAKERPLQMSVSEERNIAIQIWGDLRHILLRGHVFIFIQRGPMQNLKAVDPLRALHQFSQILGVFRLNDGLGPQGRKARHGVEPLQILQAGASLVVISADDAVDIFSNPLDHLVGIGAIADQIAAADNAVEVRAGARQHGAERFPIGVNVAEDQIAHRRRTDTSGGAPSRTGTPMVPSPFDT